jgi:hypothetical protein
MLSRAVSHQKFCDTPVLTMTALGPFGECPTSARGRYARHFRIIRQTSAPGASSRCFARCGKVVARCGKVVGHVDYCRCTALLGEESVFAFYHRLLRKVVLITAPAEEHTAAAIACICALGVVVPLRDTGAVAGSPMGGGSV